MSSILNTEARLIAFQYPYYDSIVTLKLLPGLNLNVDNKAIDILSDNKVWQQFIAKKTLVIYEVEPSIKGEKEGLNYTDLEDQEEVLVTEQEALKNPTYIPSKETLLRYSGVGNSKAERILALMPKGGWKSKADFKADTADFDVDWSPEGLKANRK